MKPLLHADRGMVVLGGEWTLAAMLPSLSEMQASLANLPAGVSWDLQAMHRLDSAAAVMLWRCWGSDWPAQLAIKDEHRRIFEHIARIRALPAMPKEPTLGILAQLGHQSLRFLNNLQGIVALWGQLLLDLLGLMRRPADFPWKELSANLFKGGAQALPVAALVGFLIGVTISYLSALQLKTFGADLFIVNILGISIIRELGPVLVAVLVAGRLGSAITAQIGVMRVTEEIDALATMGISRTQRIILPKVLALSLAMPLLVLWTSAAALLGGMLSAFLQLELSPAYFLETLPRAVPLPNLLIGFGKGVAFGFIIALIASHFGLRVRPNTESLSTKTTTSVVTSITMVIVIDAIFAILTRQVGIPQL